MAAAVYNMPRTSEELDTGQNLDESQIQATPGPEMEPGSSGKEPDRQTGKGSTAQHLDPEKITDEVCRQIVNRAEGNWLRNTDVVDILQKHKVYGLPISQEPPNMPDGGTLWLFDKKRERYFRRDGHHWRKKPNGKTVRETHEKLKVDNKDVLNCYYTHSEDQDSLQTRNRNGVAPLSSKSSLPAKSGSASQLGPPPSQMPKEWDAMAQFQQQPDLLAPGRGGFVGMMPASGSMDSALANIRSSFASAQTQIGGSAFRIPPHPSMTSLMDPNLRIPDPNAAKNSALFQAIDAQTLTRSAAEALKERRADAQREKPGNAAWQERPEQEDEPDAAAGSLEGQEGQENLDADTTTGEIDGEGRSTKKRRLASNVQTGGPKLDPGFIQLADHFQQNNIILAQHLEELRQGDRKFWQDLLTLERERIAVERDSFTAIAAAIVGHLTGLSSSQAPPAGGPPPPQGEYPYRSGTFGSGNRPQARQDHAWDQANIARDPTRRQ